MKMIHVAIIMILWGFALFAQIIWAMNTLESAVGLSISGIHVLLYAFADFKFRSMGFVPEEG